MIKENRKDNETYYIIRDSHGQPVGLAEDGIAACNEGEMIRSLYPGQPEKEDAFDDRIPEGIRSPEGAVHEKKDGYKSQAGDSEEEEASVLVPVFVTARDYIYKRYRLMMYSFMNGLLRKGELAGITGIGLKDKILNRKSFKPGFISFWRIDRSSFFADVSVRLVLETARGRKEWRGILALRCCFDRGDLTCVPEGLTKETSRREDGLIPLSPYLVPYLRNPEVDRVAEKILGRYLPEAVPDPRAGTALDLARRMGLEVRYLPVHDHKGIPSILFWEAGEIPFQDKGRIGQREPEMVMVPPNTVIVNTNEIREEYSGFNIFHECIHHELHYMACRLQKLASNDIKEVKFERVEPEKGKAIVDPVHFMEKQANRGAYGLMLTEWANAHVDECCLRFIRHYVQTGSGKYCYGRICYDADYIRQTLFYLQDLMDQDGIDKIDAKYRYRHEFPRSFKEAVNLLRKKKGISMESLAEKLDTTDKTLKRWLDEPWRFGGADLVVILALILELPDWISSMLLKRAHIQLDEDDRRHQALDHILRVQSNDGIKAANDYLRKMKLAPLSL